MHEAWLRLGADAQPAWQNRGHFFSAAAEAMRRILVDSARRKRTVKHGGHLERIELDSVDLPLPMAEDDILALDEALVRLATVDTRAVEVVKLCFFLGLTQPQAAEQMNVSLSIIERLWSFARAWLFREMLVTLHDGVPGPKVIDFGLAKAIEGRLTDGTVYTQFLQFVGTLPYMSPEQAEMSGTDVDTQRHL